MSGVHNATNWLDNPFWQYSLRQYSQPGCAQFLLDAQDQKHLDVNILLFIGWVSSQNLLLPNKRLLNRAVFLNRLLIRPIRLLRRISKQTTPNLVYQWIKRIELKAEQLEQGILHGIAHKLMSHLENELCFEKNMQMYLAGKVVDDTWLQALKQYLQPDNGTN